MSGGLLYAGMRLVKLWLPVILWATMILWASSDSFSSTQSKGWLSTVLGGEVAETINIIVRKCGHILAYAILGALAWRADRRLAVALTIAVLVASIDEYRQSLTLTRSGSPWDVLLDAAGAWLGILGAKRLIRPR